MNTVLITGSNRGLGFELSRQLSENHLVIMTGRSRDNLKKAQAKIKPNTKIMTLDISDYASIDSFMEKLMRLDLKIDLLIHNAAIIDPIDRNGPLSVLTPDIIERSFRTNAFGPIYLTNRLEPYFNENAKIIIIGARPARFSLLGSSTRSPAYRLSKLTLQGWSQIIQTELEAKGIIVTTISPGWIKSDMGGKEAPIEVADAAQSIILTMNKIDPNYQGKLVVEGEIVDW